MESPRALWHAPRVGALPRRLKSCKRLRADLCLASRCLSFARAMGAPFAIFVVNGKRRGISRAKSVVTKFFASGAPVAPVR
jgi:hypothetical protein